VTCPEAQAVMRLLIHISGVLFLVSAGAAAQSSGVSTISGTVKDPQGAVVPKASLTLKDAATGVARATESNEAGHYLFSNVLPGEYEVRAEAPGFQPTVARSVRVEVAIAVIQDFTLDIGTVNIEVEVVSSGERPLESSDSSLGNVIRVDVVKRLPNLVREAGQLMALQPGVTPLGEITGTRRDQSTYLLDGLDVSDNYSGLAFRTVIPTPTESIEEFRVIVANPNADFARSAGAQVVLQTKRGTNRMQGSAYWYHRNDALNANSWTSNRLGQARPVERDNRFGVTTGAPIRRDRTFFFAHYEGRRRNTPARITRTVPSDSLRQGLLRFLDASGAVRTVDPREFDPRGLGTAPSMLDFLRRYPQGNDPTGGDRLNTTGYSVVFSTPIRDEFGLLRLDHVLSKRWSFDGSARFARRIQTTANQVDLVAGRPVSSQTELPAYVSGALTGSFTPTLSNRLQFGWTRDKFADERQAPRAIAPYDVAIDLAGTRLDEPADVIPFRASGQGVTAQNYQWSDHLNWHRGTHQVQAGFSLRRMRIFGFRDDKASSLTTPVARLDAGQFNAISASERPSFIRPADFGVYDSLYSALLGIVENVPFSGMRDGRLQPLPAGTKLSSDHTLRAWELYAHDTWRLRPSLTLSYGVANVWQTAPVERDDRQTIAIYRSTGDYVLPQAYLRQKRELAEAGRTFNPEIAFLTAASAGRRTVFDADRNNWSPRVSAAWNPSFRRGVLGKVLAPKSVVRGGYGMLFDRTNSALITLVPSLSIGFSQSLELDAKSRGQKHRLVVDGPVPVPVVTAATSPVVPRGEQISVSIDPALRTPRHHVVDVTFQREMRGGIVLELAYVGRMARGLYQTVNLNNSPYMFKDSVSGQTFAQAFDAVAAELRSGVAPNAVTRQPWFENLLHGADTRSVAASLTNNFVVGNLNNLFQFSLDTLAAEPFNNEHVRDLWFVTSLGRSNYHAGIVTVTKRTSHGLHFDFSYTLSQSLDQVGIPQNLPQRLPNSFLPDTDYGPSVFDRRHLATALWLYELPFSKAQGGWRDRLIGGWHVSGIFTGSSGIPLGVVQSAQAYGGGLQEGFSTATAAIPVARTSDDNSIHRSAGSGGVGTNAASASGLNYFADPEAAYKNFRRIRLASDTRSGRGTLRGFPSWNVDLALGKTTRIGERIRAGLTFEFFNVFNNVIFANPALDLRTPQSFGVVTAQSNSPRLIQAGLRLEW
jgi:hypothetical protein